ncbi:hypothetical protein FGADI_12257 [Fusarium gaditjirri]|uniref:Protein kinase domain-containing protein n=1 Tax=Fusarium gaditjirri TaxID=282569 RepID=A0A8H4SSK0_9HYPO|nr:hypothetical protein FGADI_12257 [Fusarium gaditjirri]
MCNDKRFIIRLSADTFSESPKLKERYLFFLKVAEEFELDGVTVEDFWDWIVDPLLPIFRKLPTPDQGTVRTLNGFFNPETFIYAFQTVSDERIPQLDRDAYHQPSFGIFVPDELCASWKCFDPSEVQICHENVVGPPSDTPRKVLLNNGTIAFLKLARRGDKQALKNELDIYGKIDRAQLDNKSKISRLHGLVRNNDGVTYGLLLTYIDCKRVTLSCAVKPGTEVSLRERWAAQIRESVSQLHDAGIVWGDVKPDNVLIDVNEDAWLIDFGGGYTEGWVPKTLAGTMEAPPQASGPQLPSDPFSTLHAEINIQVLECLALHDIQADIASSPILLRTLDSNRRYILRPYLNEHLRCYRDESSFRLAATAMHLRELHSNHDGDTISELEKQLEPVLDAILRLNSQGVDENRDISLYMVIAAQELLPEMTSAVQIPTLESIGLLFRQRQPWPRENPWIIKTTFTEGFLRFDCYRNLFYHGRHYLFQDRARIKDAFLNSFPKFPSFDKDVRRHTYMIQGNILSMYDAMSREAHRSKFQFKFRIDRPNEISPNTIAAFQKRTQRQHDYFLYRLSLQGYPRLEFLWHLSPETLFDTMMEEFQELVLSKLEDCETWEDESHYRNLVMFHSREQSLGNCIGSW